MLQTSLRNFDFTIKELKIYKGEKNVNFFREVISEEATYNRRITELKSLINNTPITHLAKKIPFLQGIPLYPYPKVERCLGLEIYNG